MNRKLVLVLVILLSLDGDTYFLAIPGVLYGCPLQW